MLLTFLVDQIKNEIVKVNAERVFSVTRLLRAVSNMNCYNITLLNN